MTFRAPSLTLAALLLCVPSFALAQSSQRVQGTVVEHQGKVYVLQPKDVSTHEPEGSFTQNPKSPRRMLAGPGTSASLWSKVDKVFEVRGTKQEMDVLKRVDLLWVDLEGVAELTSDTLARDPGKHGVHRLYLDALKNPQPKTIRGKAVERRWEWKASASGGLYTWTDMGVYLGDQKVEGSAVTALMRFASTPIAPFPRTAFKAPATLAGKSIGYQVPVRGFLYSHPKLGTHFYGEDVLQTVAEASRNSRTVISTGPGLGLPLPRTGATTVAGPTSATPIKRTVVMGPNGSATPITRTSVNGPVANTPITGAPLKGTPTVVMGPNGSTPITRTPVAGPATTTTIVPVPVKMSNPATTPVRTIQPGAATKINKLNP